VNAQIARRPDNANTAREEKAGKLAMACKTPALLRLDPMFDPLRNDPRLQKNSRRPQPDEMRSIFAALGLGGNFWDPQSDTFG
jgi:hypothetical protein